MNDDLIRQILEVGRRQGNSCRIAIDERRLTTSDDFSWMLEEDYWHGPPLTDDFIDDPYQTGLTVHKYPDDDPHLSLGYESIEAFWSPVKKANKTIQMEEILVPSRKKVGGVHVLRYLHSIRDIESKSFVHCDGAVRCYTDDQYLQRRNTRVHTAERALHYRKVFRIDGNISSNEWSNISVLWFRGNRLVQEYLSNFG
jgi:hypothetical protein